MLGRERMAGCCREAYGRIGGIAGRLDSGGDVVGLHILVADKAKSLVSSKSLGLASRYVAALYS